VAKQWYDFDRSSFIFVKKLREGQTFTFRHQHDFDENGIVYWIGTNAKYVSSHRHLIIQYKKVFRK
jgi:E3 ubiquitin-protein ligase HECTD1